MNVETPHMGPESMSPDVRISDPATRWWCAQVVLRLRREVAWQRHLGSQDPAQVALDLLRHGAAKATFFADDLASCYLSERLGSHAPEGRFSRLATLTGLSTAEQFVLAMGIAARVDGALGPVFATCHGDAGCTRPSLALAQQLWDDPVSILDADDPSRPLQRLGLIDQHWTVASMLARPLAQGLAPMLSAQRREIKPGAARLEQHALATRLAGKPDHLEVVALTGSARADAGRLIASLGTARKVWQVSDQNARTLRQWLVLAWIEDADVWLETTLTDRDAVAALVPALVGEIAVRLFLHVDARDHLATLPQDRIGPVIAIPPLSHDAREVGLRAVLGNGVADATIREVAHDFRLEASEVARIRATDAEELEAACRAACGIDFQGLAEPLKPRFERADIVLPLAIEKHFDEAVAAIRGATRLHQDWGGTKLGDGGIPLLFAGVPGTGKTMAAEVIASETGLPLFRIDLSQLVNKYIGETEKNLKRVFDAAERMRCILFFDEADALFGRRSEIKDANDRFANITSGYLLQRMDNFSGVSVLATNRRKDLDEAFSRRLRYIIEFPMPSEAERRRIWERVFPPSIDTNELDLLFLARQFQITGGHIRSIALNAGLQAAARGTKAHVTMRDVLIATKRELDKLNRKSGADAFGQYFSQIEELQS